MSALCHIFPGFDITYCIVIDRHRCVLMAGVGYRFSHLLHQLLRHGNARDMLENVQVQIWLPMHMQKGFLL